MRTVIAAAVFGAFAAAQAQDKPPAAPPSWQQGKPTTQSESTLHPFAIEMTGKAAKDLPTDKLKVPAGFKVEVWAEGMPGARTLAPRRQYLSFAVAGATDQGSAFPELWPGVVNPTLRWATARV